MFQFFEMNPQGANLLQNLPPKNRDSTEVALPIRKTPLQVCCILKKKVF
jgi:hypothetical protein